MSGGKASQTSGSDPALGAGSASGSGYAWKYDDGSWNEEKAGADLPADGRDGTAVRSA